MSDGLAVYVIYANPSDYPGKYVVRRQVVTSTAIVNDAEPLGVVDTLDQARALLPVMLIVETWL